MRGVRAVLVMAAFALWTWGALAGRLAGFDAAWQADGASAGMQWLTRLGDPLWVLLVAAALAVVLASRGEHWMALWSGLVPVAAYVSVWILKALIARPRPTETLASWAYPSGHAAMAAALYGVVAWELSARLPSAPRAAVRMAGGLLVVAVAASRIALGVHWPADVVGGALWVAVLWVLLRWWLGPAHGEAGLRPAQPA